MKTIDLLFMFLLNVLFFSIALHIIFYWLRSMKNDLKKIINFLPDRVLNIDNELNPVSGYKHLLFLEKTGKEINNEHRN